MDERPWLVQLGGHAGSGKSTLAQELARALGALVLDLDVIKSALLESGVDWDASGRASYRLIDALAEQALGGAVSVVVDTPSYWPELHERMRAIADRQQASYRFLECVCPDEIRLQRVRSRIAHRSQIRDADHGPVDAPVTDDAVVNLALSRSIARPTAATTVVDTSSRVNVLTLLESWREHAVPSETPQPRHR